ncbi:MAG: hypothetical protein JO316_01335 [Abitibacteriaceae bacterium]|nr:hypothetical protein [Abditibacteriaceae bacterium]MBV9863973.1 hypothetical protein [Abditibacteriaceae bacterium]
MSNTQIIAGEALGSPTEAGVVHIRGIGHIYVSQAHVEFLVKHGNDYDVEIVDCTSPGSLVREWQVLRFL